MPRPTITALLGIGLLGCSTSHNRGHVDSVLSPARVTKPMAVAPPPERCGDGVVNALEACDDGNDRGGDGCSIDCKLEPVFLFGFHMALLSDGRVVGPATPDSLETIPGKSVLQDGFTRVKIAGRTYLLRENVHPTPLPSFFKLGTIKKIAPSARCLLTHAGEVWCRSGTWLERFKEHVEDGIGTPWYKLERRSATQIVDVAGGALGGCALLTDGRVDCWFGETPILSFPHPITQVAISTEGGYESGFHVCVLDQLGEVGCWGSATAGQLGYTTPEADDIDGPRWYAPNPPETFLRFPHPATKLYALLDETCALLSNNDLWCWGNTGWLHFRGEGAPQEYWRRAQHNGGPLDTSHTPQSTLPAAPVALPADCTVRQLLPLEKRICVLCESGCAKCWNERPPTKCSSFE